MVSGEAVGEQADLFLAGGFDQQFEVDVAVVGDTEDVAVIVAALGDLVGAIGQEEAG